MAEWDTPTRKTRARKALDGSYSIIGEDEDENDEEGTDEPADIVGLAEKKKKKEKESSWGKKVAAAIAGTIGAVAGANLQHRQNARKEKAYQAKRKTGNYL
jgi:hypothetical protein